MIQTHFIAPLAVSLRDLVPWLPIVVIIVALSAFGIVLKVPHSRNPHDRDED